jgi:predicted nucleic acid-binding protein
MKIFVDTSAFYALLDRADTNHKKANAVWIGMLNGEDTLVTSNYVLVESFALLQSRHGIEAVRVFQEDILPLINVQFVDPEIHRPSVAGLMAASKRNLSLVDCVSFEVMRASGIKAVFTFDPHFKEQGFTVIP